MSKMMFRILSVYLILQTVTVTTTFAQSQSQETQSDQSEILRTIGTVLDYQSECLSPMQFADKDFDSILSRSEYVKFIQSYSLNPLFQVESFGDLPLTLVQEYVSWICAGYCNFFTNDNDQQDQSTCLDSCQDGIPIVPPDGFTNDDLKPYLYSVCESTIKEVQRIVDPNWEDSGDSGDGPEPPEPPMEEEEVEVPFGVANLIGLDALMIAEDQDGVLTDVISVALDKLQEQVQNNLYVERLGGVGNRMLRTTRRKVEVIALKSWVKSIDDQPCPETILDEYSTAKCQHYLGIFKIAVVGQDDLTLAATQVQNQAKTFITDGDLQSHVPPESQNDFIFYSLDDSDGEDTFPFIAIVSVAAGAVLIGLFAGRALVVNRRGARGSQLPGDEYVDSDADFPSGKGVYGGMLKGIDDEDVEAMQVEKGESVVIGAYDDTNMEGQESESDVGSSGWSSSAGMSSLNTGNSVDSAEFFGSSLAAIGAASNVHKKFLEGSTNDLIYPIKSGDDDSHSEGSERKSDSDRMSPGHQQRKVVSRDDLEKQIEAGDWAAVGATAACLSNDSRSTAGSVSSGFGSDCSASCSGLSSALSGTSRDRARAAELDRLVDTGDWDGVVLTAAKFEAESDRDDRTDGSASGKSSYKSAADRSFANLSVGSPSVSTNVSDVKRSEMRAEVESLVRRVVPEEIENVDEMMLQFQGREEELVETLRTMQERSIAARQREASRRNAKREAKKLAKEAKKANNSVSSLPPRSKPLTSRGSPSLKLETEKLVNSSDMMSIPSKGDSNASDNTPQRLALDAAIAAGDWEAVGRTAEQLGDGGDSSVDTSDFESATSANDLDSSAYMSTTSSPDAARAAELEELIEDKDWSGVVAAASRYSTAGAKSKDGPESTNDDQKSKSSGSSSGWRKIPFLSGRRKSASDEATEDSGRDKNTKKEEEEARAQANIWSSIAEESRAKGSTAIGASDAADWAISRSLKQIQDSSVFEDSQFFETQSVDSNNDDTSV